MALKAEVVIGVLLTVRHRTVRLAGFLAGALLLLGSFAESAVSRGLELVLVISGTVAAVAASRLLAPGEALAAARRAGADWWVSATGRLAGVWLLILPAAWVAALILAEGMNEAIRVAWVAAVYGGAVGAVTLALTPFMGATGAAALGLLGVWLGGLPPSGIYQILSGWEYVRRPAVWLWNVLPLDWRALRWGRVGGLEDPMVMAAWIVVGVMMASWAISRAESGTASPGE
ncbi:MAG: hypothetical protein ACE5PT_13110 [Gemmatimonadales bacterium]